MRPKPCDGDDPPLKGVDFVGRRKESLLGHFFQEVQRNQTQTLHFLFFLRGKDPKFSLLVAFLTFLHVQTLVSGCSPAKLRFVTLGHLPCSHMGRSLSAPGAELKLSAVPVMMLNAEFYSDFSNLEPTPEVRHSLVTELQPQQRLCPFLHPHTRLVAPQGLQESGNWEDGLPREPLDSGSAPHPSTSAAG